MKNVVNIINVIIVIRDSVSENVEISPYKFISIYFLKGEEAQLERHIAELHNRKKKHLCNICGKFCVSEMTLRQHMLQHGCNSGRTFKVGLFLNLFFYLQPKRLVSRMSVINVKNHITAKMVWSII